MKQEVFSVKEIQKSGGLQKWMVKEGGREEMKRSLVDLSIEKELISNKSKRKRPSMSEHEEQVELFKVFRANQAKYAELEFAYAIPNGGKRHLSVAKKLKAEGVKPGVSDIFIPAPRLGSHGLYVEMKAKGGKISKNQEHMAEGLTRLGYTCIVAFGWENAWREIEEYLNGPVF